MIQQRSTLDGLQYVQLHTTLPVRNVIDFLINRINPKKKIL